MALACSIPKVTVFIPVYNRASYVGAAIESVLSQSFTDFELLLIDDGSSDDSAAVIRRHDDPRIRLVCNDGNRGIPFTRNRGLELARGEYIAFLDSDDIMAPRRLARQVAFLDRRRDIATVGGWVTKFNAAGRPIRHLVKPLDPDQLRPWLLFRCCHANSSMMGRTAAMREFGYREDFGVSEDYDLWVRMSAKYRSANLPHVLTLMREHDERTTNKRAEHVQAAKLKIAERQLTALGHSYKTADLQRHCRLTRMRRDDWRSDPAFLDWARGWLEALQAANRTSRIYSDRALAGVLSQVWFHSCWHAAPVLGRAKALFCFMQSPLRAGIATMLVDNLAFALGRERRRARGPLVNHAGIVGGPSA